MPTDTRQEILDLFTQIDETYWGPEERAMIDRAIALSQELGDEELEYKARIRLTASAARTGDTDAQITSFAWCLAKHDADPHRFPNDIENNAADLMWQFKWMIGSLDCNPIFSLDQGDAMLADMEAHYVKEGVGPSGVITARFQHAWTTGNIDKAKELRAVLTSTPRDDHSHCDACGRSELAGFAAEFGEEEIALKLVDEIMEGHFSCGEEPEHALSRTLVAKLRADRLDDALDSHLRSYRLARRNPDNLTIVADNMVFCAITGNEARGLAMVERHISWLAHDALNESGQLNLLTAIAAVLESVIASGHGDQVVRGADSEALGRFFGTHEGTWTVSDLAAASWEAAERLASAFDERNGNDYRSSKVAKARDLLSEHWDLPVASEVFLPTPVTAAAPSTAAEWLALAEVHVYSGNAPAAIEALRSGLDTNGADPYTRTRLWQLLVSSLLQVEDTQAAQDALRERIAALREAGRDLQADLETRMGLGLFGDASPQSAEALEAELVTLSATPGPELADVELTLADTLLSLANQQDESSDDAQEEAADTAEVDRFIALYESAIPHAETLPALQSSGLFDLAVILATRKNDLERGVSLLDDILALPVSDGCKAAVWRERARMLGGLERYDEGATSADEAVAILARYQASDAVIRNSLLAAALLRDAGRMEEAVNRIRYALREAEHLGGSTTGLRYQLGETLRMAGHPVSAVEVLWEVLRDEEEAEVGPADRGETAFELALGFQACEKYGNAVSMFEQAADLYEEGERPAMAADMLRRRGNMFRDFDMPEEALESLTRSWELAEDLEEDYVIRVNIAEALAMVKGRQEDPTALDDMDKALAILESDPSGPYLWRAADLIDTKARVLGDLKREEEAVATFLLAGDKYAEAGDLAASARAEHFASQVLTKGLERAADAVPVWKSALEHVDAAIAAGADAGDMRQSIVLQWGDALESLGRTSEAAQVRALLDEKG
ncbi:MAG: hypothetical protein LBN10_02665 [Propionibacteriaceae bacterium]|jgi:tetratricopeptide (TPR) repeat protein|nr:hypothetical protein [Propionibacteriaceae bacterium]